MNQLEATHDDVYDGLGLHLLRALGVRRGGTAEGKLFKRIAFDLERRPPVRCWAWKAWGNTDDWSVRESIDATEAEVDPTGRRASLVPLRSRGAVSRDRFLRHIVLEHKELGPMARWVREAA